jgi:lipopolysaccharide/colanic/teichoic acid biosynthesis glycosyltransferase
MITTPPKVFFVRSSGLFQRGFDLLAGIPFFLIAIPVILLCWMLVRATSKGPGFYSQVRVGRFGKPYRIFKVRTMAHQCESSSGIVWASLKGDSRVTRIGRVLRKLHLDELPQLWNIVRGEMSLVGPRPERPEFVEPLSKTLPDYLTRLQVRPGLTGLAQIQLPADSDIKSVKKKLVLDKCYVNERNLWLDVRICVGTALYLARISYPNVRRILSLPNPLINQQPSSSSDHKSNGGDLSSLSSLRLGLGAK